MSKYNPKVCKSSIELFGVYLCRFNGGVPCALHTGDKCYLQKIDEAVSNIANVLKNNKVTE